MNAIMVTHADMATLYRLRAHAPLRRELDRAVLVSSHQVPPDVATMDSTVRYVDETTGEERIVSLAYPQDADAAAGRISILAPVGTALLGLSVGQSIEWEFPDGSCRRLKLKEVLRQPERMGHSPLPRAP